MHLRERLGTSLMSLMATGDQEEQAYRADVAAVKEWWTDFRWRYTKRPYTAEQIVAKRGNMKIEYPSNVQSKKLWSILEKRFQVRLRDLQGRVRQMSKGVRAHRGHDLGSRCELHIWLSRSRHGHSDGQVS